MIKTKLNVVLVVAIATVILCGAGAGMAAQVMNDKPGLGPTIAIHKDLPTDTWPQLQNTPQRTGYSPAKVKLPLEPKWSVNLTDLDIDNKTSGTVQAIIAEGKVYVGCRNGRFFALDTKTGKKLWERRLSGGRYWATPVIAGNHLYVINADGKMDVVKLAGEKKGEIVAKSRFGEAIFGTPAVAGGAMFVRSDKHLWKVADTSDTVASRE